MYGKKCFCKTGCIQVIVMIFVILQFSSTEQALLKRIPSRELTYPHPKAPTSDQGHGSKGLPLSTDARESWVQWKTGCISKMNFLYINMFGKFSFLKL